MYAALAAKENEQVEMFLNEYLVEENGEQDEKQFPLEVMQEVHEVHETQEQESPVETEKTIALKQEEQAISWVRQVNINRKKLEEFDYLRQNFYQVDSSTTTDKEQLNIKKWMDKDLTLKESKGDEPQILIYHTHSQEAYKDSKKGDASMTVVGVGAYLTKLLRETYGLKVMHHTGEYDVGDRDHAYSNAAPALKKILEEHPSIQMVIDVHRDGVAEKTHLVTTLNGKPTAKLMFFNGLCRTAARGKLTSLTNPYIEENLAFSFRMQLMANEYFPGLTRKIYLKGYRYNMHYRPYSMLVEVGAQTNTFAEAKNAMEPLAALLAHTVKGE